MSGSKRQLTLRSAAAAAVLLALLSGCAEPHQQSLERALAEARNRPVGSVPALPQFPAIVPLSYSASGLRSPFHSPLLDVGSDQLAGAAVAAPDLTRPRTALELLPLGSLQMVGSMLVDGVRWGLVEGGGRIFTVAPGDFVGQNFGRVSSVAESRIELLEKVPGGDGEWRLRPRTMVLRNVAK